MKLIKVAPLVGAWIEINQWRFERNLRMYVAPLVGAWIEIACAEHG